MKKTNTVGVVLYLVEHEQEGMTAVSLDGVTCFFIITNTQCRLGCVSHTQ